LYETSVLSSPSPGLGLGLLLAAPQAAEAQRKAPPDGAYKKVSTLVQGPFLAYDRQGNLVSSIYRSRSKI
jgi:hypothetical protein